MMDDIIQDFLMETSENLEQLDIDIVSLEQDHNNKELLGNIFRTIHTIKGTCGFIGLPRLEKVAHHGEDVLGRFRDGDLDINPQAITAILSCIDTIKEIMAHIEETGEEPEGDDTDLFAALNVFMHDQPEESIETSSIEAPQEQSDVDDVIEKENSDCETVPEGKSEDLLGIFTPIPMADAEFNEPLPDANPDKKEDPEEAQEKIVEPETPILKEIKVDAVVSKPAKTEVVNKKPEKQGPSIASQNIRVNVSMLESLITSVSELVLARNQLLQIARDSDNDEFKVPLQRLNHITSELQEGLMQTRMQPVGTAWSQLPRIVRDLSQDLDKDINLEMIGAETELDRQVIEVIKDPLMHMVRNSADHGLESPQERVAAGKNRQGSIVLKAYHAGGHVIIEISDNGRGLNKDRIIEKIIGNELSTPEQVENMSDSVIYNHIFAAGFSTAAVVTNVSGRGVGMDVVKSNIEKIGGSVEVNSKPGFGSVFTVKIPLTLAIVSALIIKSSQQRFAIPQTSIIELVQTSKESEHTVEYVNDHPVLRLRNNLLPLIMLSDVLHITPESKEEISSIQTDIEEPDSEKNQNLFEKSTINQDQSIEDQFIIVTQVGSGQFGIIVDKVYDTEEIVVKPVSKLLRSAKLFAGNTILGDGSVVMILDPKSIADKSGDIQTSSHDTDKESLKSVNSPDERRMRFLVFKAGEGGPKAVPLDLIVRLEEIDTDKIETSNGMNVLQYRNRLMPLTSVAGYIDTEPGHKKSVLVFQQHNEYVGIVVDEIVDIVEENLDIKMNTSMGGSYGSMVINDITTDLLDVDYFINQVCPNWSSMLDGDQDSNALAMKKSLMTIAFIDKCKLYRNLISPLLELQNIKSLAFDDGDTALNYLSNHPTELDAFILDKDSLGADSGAFLKSCKENFPDVPFFIVGADFNATEEVLFREYECVACLAKNDRDSIIVTLKDYLEQTRSLAA